MVKQLLSSETVGLQRKKGGDERDRRGRNNEKIRVRWNRPHVTGIAGVVLRYEGAYIDMHTCLTCHRLGGAKQVCDKRYGTKEVNNLPGGLPTKRFGTKRCLERSSAPRRNYLDFGGEEASRSSTITEQNGLCRLAMISSYALSDSLSTGLPISRHTGHAS